MRATRISVEKYRWKWHTSDFINKVEKKSKDSSAAI